MVSFVLGTLFAASAICGSAFNPRYEKSTDRQTQDLESRKTVCPIY